jgi:hypothetical protein
VLHDFRNRLSGPRSRSIEVSISRNWNNRIDQLALMATIANAQVVRTLCDKCPDDPPELSVFAVSKLRDMIKSLKEWHDEQPWEPESA